MDVDIRHSLGSQQQRVLERCDPGGIVAGALSSNPKIAIAREVHDMYAIGCRLRKRDRDRFPINREMNA